MTDARFVATMPKPAKKQAKFVSVKQARDTLSALIAESRTTPVVILSHTRPVAILRGVDGLSLQEAAAVAEAE